MKKLTSALLLAALLASGCGRDDPATLIASAKEYMVKRDYNASIIQLKNTLQKEPENAEARYLLGLASLELGDVVSAEIELNKALELGEASDEFHIAYGRMLLAKREIGRFFRDFGSKALSSPRQQAELLALIGVAHRSTDQRKAAEAAFAKALAIDPANVTANLGLARYAAADGKFSEARKHVDTALATAPGDVQANMVKADLLIAQGEDAEAEKAYREAKRAAPWNPAPPLALVHHLVRQRALNDAWKEVVELEKSAPSDPRTAIAKSLVLVEQRRFAEALPTIQLALKVLPDHAPSLTIAGMAALQTGALLEAESYLRKALFNSPQSVDTRRLLATTQLRMGRTEQALATIQELMRTGHANDPRLHALAGEAYLASGDAPSAARHYERAKSLAPANTRLQTRLALVRFAEGDAGRGIAELESAAASSPDAYDADLALIAAHLRQRRPDDALEAIQHLEKKQPNNPLTHHLRGVAQLLKRDRPAARASFERALQIRPTYLPAVSQLAQLDLQDKKPADARKRFEAVLKLEPKNEQAMLGLAVLLRVEGADPREIEKVLRQSIAANPASATARGSLVNFHLRNRNPKAALAAAQEAHAALPSHPSILQALGLAQLLAGEPRQAITSFTRLSEILPKAPGPRILLARAQFVAKEHAEGLKALRSALDLRPELAVVQRDLPRLYVAAKNPEEGVRHARELQAAMPDEPHGHVLEAEIRMAEKKFDLAESKYRETLKRFDQPAIAVRALAAMEASGKHAEAQALVQQWFKRHPDDVTVVRYLADRDVAAKRYESAARRYQTVLKRQPDNAAVLNNLAWVLHELKRPAALEYAERAHELAPNNPGIMDTLGTILARSGETERALELLSRASELAPEHHVIRLNFARALIQADHKVAARRELEVLAKLDSRLAVQREAAKLLEGL